MTGHNLAVTLGSLLMVCSTLLSAVMIWMVLARPMAVAEPAGGPGPVGVVRTAVMTLHHTVMEHFKHSTEEPQ